MPSKKLTDWADKLDKLVLDGAKAVQADDLDAMVAVQNALLKFIDESPGYAAVLDQQAQLAILDIDLGNTQNAATGLRARRLEISRIITSLEGMAAELTKDAASLRLERITTAVESAAKVIVALKDARDALKSTGDDKVLREAIEKVITSIQDVRSKLETA
jgi:hypothetical protein